MLCDARHPTKDLKCDGRKGHASAHDGWTCQAYKNHTGPHFVKKDHKGTMFSWPVEDAPLARFKAAYQAAAARTDCSTCGQKFATRDERVAHENGHFTRDLTAYPITWTWDEDAAIKAACAPYRKIPNADAGEVRMALYDKPLYAWGNPIRYEEIAGCSAVLPVARAFELAKLGYASQMRPIISENSPFTLSYLCSPKLWAEWQKGGVTAFSPERVFADARWWTKGTLPDLGYDD